MAAGPFFLIPDSALALTPTDFDFTTFTANELADLDANLALNDIEVAAAILELDEPSDPDPEFDFNGLFDLLGTTTFDVENGFVSTMVDGASQGDTLLTDAVNTAPDQAFLPQPPPFDPNVDQAVNLNYGTGAQVPTSDQGPTNVGPGQAFNQLVTAPGYTFSLVDLTRLTSDSFTVGDQFRFDITGPPFQKISVEYWHDGVHTPAIPTGAFGADGKYTLTGPVDPVTVGAWSEYWFGGDVMIQWVAFFVVPQP